MYHSSIIKVAAEYYKLSPKGVCRGATLRWIEARHLNEESKYNNRLNFILNNQSLVAGLFSSKKFPTELQNQEILAFFDSLALYQDPQKYEEVFDKTIAQRDTEEISKLAASKKMAELGGLVSVATNLRLFTKTELTAYLNELAQNFDATVPKIQGPITFTLSTLRHAMGICYEIGKGWKFMDINQYPPTEVSNNHLNIIADKIFNLYDKNNTKHLSLEIALQSPKLNPFNSVLSEKLNYMQKKYVPGSDMAKEPEAASLLVTAISLGFTKIVKNLLENGIDLQAAENLSNKGRLPNELSTLVWNAYAYENFEIVKLLIEANANIEDSKKGLSLFYLSAQDGQLEVLKALVARSGKDKLSEFYSNFSPLLIACQNGHFEVVKYLIESGVNINQISKSGVTGLHMACQEGQIAIVKYLLEKGAKEDLNGLMCLAIQEGHTNLIRLLVSYPLRLNCIYSIPFDSLKNLSKDAASQKRLESFLKAHKNFDSKWVKIELKDIAKIIDDKELLDYLKGNGKVPKVIIDKPKMLMNADSELAHPAIVNLPEDANTGPIANFKLSTAKKSIFFKQSNTQDAILKLKAYIDKRKNAGRFHYNFLGLVTFYYILQKYFAHNLNIAAKSRETKLSAARKVMKMLSGKPYKDFSETEILACKDGELGKILEKNKIKVDEFINHPQLKLTDFD